MSEELELVTVGKLQKFADRLSPYLGGKNVYSLEEQRVGLWIDGKPVYQKVVYINICLYSFKIGFLIII